MLIDQQTPTPRRFLLPKRPPTQSPAPQASQQFHSTPRFGSSSVPRPTQRRAHEIEDVEEDGDESLDDSVAGDAESRSGRLQDTIEIESDALTSQDTEHLSQSSHEEDDIALIPDSESSQLSPDRREVKRRRVSISPARSSSLNAAETTPTKVRASTPENQTSSQAENEVIPQQEPIFRPAPRFKPAETVAPPILPEAFSPQRRGAKYLPGGMASQLQGWLSEVKGWEGPPDEDSALRVTVEDVSPGARMYLVRGRVGESDASKGYILAGEGKLTGLGRRAVVRVGSLVVIEEPVWEVTLLREVWTVGCNWSVVG